MKINKYIFVILLIFLSLALSGCVEESENIMYIKTFTPSYDGFGQLSHYSVTFEEGRLVTPETTYLIYDYDEIELLNKAHLDKKKVSFKSQISFFGKDIYDIQIYEEPITSQYNK